MESECGQALDITAVREPAIRAIALQSRIEKELLRNLNVSLKGNEVEFWEKYLSSFDFIMRSHDYQELYEFAMRWLPKGDKHRILDAGCGIGNFIIWLLNNYSNKKSSSRRHAGSVLQSMEYIGFDYAQATLEKAKHRVLARINGSAQSFSLPQWSFVYGDLNKRLPFDDNFFDFSSGNLVLSYVDDPLFTLREFFRVLSLGGRAVLSSLKHNPDLGIIFNEFARDAQGDELEKARGLLNNAGAHPTSRESGTFSVLFDWRTREVHGICRVQQRREHACDAESRHYGGRREKVTFYALSAVANGVFSLAAGLLIYFSCPVKGLRWTYIFFCVSVLWWSIFYFLWQMTGRQDHAIIFCRLLMVGAIYIPISNLHHLIILLNAEKRHAVLLRALYVLSAFWVVVTAFTPLIVKTVVPISVFRFWPIGGALFTPFLGVFTFTVLFAVYLIVKHLYRMTGIKRTQLVYVLAGTIIGWTGAADKFPALV